MRSCRLISRFYGNPREAPSPYCRCRPGLACQTEDYLMKMKATDKSLSSKESKEILHELHDDVISIEPFSEEALLKKYDKGQAQIITQRNDFLVPNILQMVRDKEVLNLAPVYQRRKRWSDTKKSHLVESLLMNIPIPPIFLYERDLAKYEVMDGQQRL